MEHLLPIELPPGVSLEDLRVGIEGVTADPRDRALIELMVSGERASAAYADVLGISELLPLEQRRLIKQHKDRLNARLKRLGGQLRHD